MLLLPVEMKGESLIREVGCEGSHREGTQLVGHSRSAVEDGLLGTRCSILRRHGRPLELLTAELPIEASLTSAADVGCVNGCCVADGFDRSSFSVHEHTPLPREREAALHGGPRRRHEIRHPLAPRPTLRDGEVARVKLSLEQFAARLGGWWRGRRAIGW